MAQKAPLPILMFNQDKDKNMIAFVEMKDAWERDFIKKKMKEENRLLFLDEPFQDRVKDLKEARILSVFVNSRVDKKQMELLPDLKCIATRSTGFDHIDLAAAKQRGIVVCNVPAYGENTVAEHTFALILSLSRNLRKAYLRTVQNNFSLDGLMGFDLKGKTLGVIGTGHIGLHVIRMASGFGMKVIAFDVKQQSFLAEVLNFQYASFEDLLKQSDIISLHAPYLPSTRHLINKNNIGLIKKGAVLVNTARGGLIETGALVEALDKKILSGVGLDVLEEEEYLLEEKRLLESAETEEHWKRLQTTLKNHVLLHRENVIYTPHMAFYSCEAVQRILETTVENIHAFTAGKFLNQVNL
jgi:D-lactate dehydrogenase